jgi:predicted dehydrogenase
MRQLLQSSRDGGISLFEVPIPKCGEREVLVQTAASLVSSGTERMALDFAKRGLAQKARARPDLVRQVVEKAQKDGVATTIRAVQARLDQPTPMGYSSAGTVVEVGTAIQDMHLGERVACSGGGYAVHAEFVAVPRNLVAPIPDDVSLEDAAFASLGAIALHGIRLGDTRLGETVAVIGLGLVGQLAVQLLEAAGCRVVGIDPNPHRAQLAFDLGAHSTTRNPEELSEILDDLTGGIGADAVLIAADSNTNEPIELAADAARDRANIVALGAVGLDIPRRTFYEKELRLQVSRSYGPGRYDSSYEEKGFDYPVGYVRWTEQRNMVAFLSLLESRKVKLEGCISHRLPIQRAEEAYEIISGKTGEAFLAILLTYDGPVAPGRQATSISLPDTKLATTDHRRAASVNIGLLGAGSYAINTLLPVLAKVPEVQLVGVCTKSGVSGHHAREKFGFRYATNRESELLEDPSINSIVIATPHNLHAGQVVAALEAGKHVFCEKPLCLNVDELQLIWEAREKHQEPLLMVGFNRRWAPAAVELAGFFEEVRAPLHIVCRVNAGHLPVEHWTRDLEVGGGRLIGEACHFVDFLGFVARSRPRRVTTTGIGKGAHSEPDNCSVTIEFENESIGTLAYLTNGSSRMSKERIEVFGGGRSAVVDDWRRLTLYGKDERRVRNWRWSAQKGHLEELQQFAEAVTKGHSDLPPFSGYAATMAATFAVGQSLQLRDSVVIQPTPVDEVVDKDSR